MKFLENKNNILYIGVGGGYDIMGAIPFYQAMPNAKCVFANYNSGAKAFTKFTAQDPADVCIEKRLADWSNQTVYTLPKAGVKAVRSQIAKIIQDHQIEIIVLVDGGVDSLMHGDEEGAGTWLDDTVAMTAINGIDEKIPKILACIGFGTELEEELCHYHVLKNMAELIAMNAFYGTFSLTKQNVAFQKYQEACEYVWQGQRKSHIHTKIISAVHGFFGEQNLYNEIDAQVSTGVKCKNFTSPLMSLYW